MGIDLDKVKKRLRELQAEKFQAENDTVKNSILIKLNSFYGFLTIIANANFSTFDFEHLRFDLEYLDDLIKRYKQETEYLTKEDLLKVNKMYRKYKYHE